MPSTDIIRIFCCGIKRSGSWSGPIARVTRRTFWPNAESAEYSSTLFRYDERFFQKLGPALELGRSFVRLEYQRQYAPLLLLWKGIARMVARQPEIPVLFGAVSISNDYNEASRELIYRYFESRMREDALAGLIEPRRPFRPAPLRKWDCRSIFQALRDLDDLSQPINDVELDGKGLPILLRQYAKVGGKLVGFNVDRKFSNVLDGLVVVDLRQTEPAVLERYMGQEGEFDSGRCTALRQRAEGFTLHLEERRRVAFSDSAHACAASFSASSRFSPRRESSS